MSNARILLLALTLAEYAHTFRVPLRNISSLIDIRVYSVSNAIQLVDLTLTLEDNRHAFLAVHLI